WVSLRLCCETRSFWGDTPDDLRRNLRMLPCEKRRLNPRQHSAAAMSLLTRYVNRPLTIWRGEARLRPRRVVALPLPGNSDDAMSLPKWGRTARAPRVRTAESPPDTYGQSNLGPIAKTQH